MANVSAFTGAMPVIPGGTVELGYAEKTSTVAVNVGSGAQVSVIGPLTIVTDGSPLMVEFFCEEAAAPATAGAYLIAALWVDGAENTRTMGVAYAGATGSNHGETLHAVRRVTLSAGSHTIEIKGWSSAAANFYAGAGGTAAYAPMFLRVSKIVNQNDGLKPFWTPPIVTQLPSQATVGDQVLYAADATNGVYWQFQYDGLGTYPWKFIGGAPLLNTVAASESTANPSYVALTTAGPQITVPVAGDYDVLIGCNFNGGAGNDIPGVMSFLVGGTAASDSDAVWISTRGPGYDSTISKPSRKTGIAASTALVARYKSPASAGMIFGQRFMRVTPIRVSA